MTATPSASTRCRQGPAGGRGLRCRTPAASHACLPCLLASLRAAARGPRHFRQLWRRQRGAGRPRRHRQAVRRRQALLGGGGQRGAQRRQSAHVPRQLRPAVHRVGCAAHAARARVCARVCVCDQATCACAWLFVLPPAAQSLPVPPASDTLPLRSVPPYRPTPQWRPPSLMTPSLPSPTGAPPACTWRCQASTSAAACRGLTTPPRGVGAGAEGAACAERAASVVLPSCHAGGSTGR